MTSPKRSGRSSEDGLPSGWSVSVRVRSSGKKDRKYYAPSGLKFNSKVEVTRYLKTLDGVSLQPNVEKHAESDGAPEHEKEDEMRIKETVENHICKEVERSSSSPGEKDNAGFEKSINLRGSSVKDGENTMIEENVAQFKGLAASPECKGDKYVNDQNSEKNSVSHIKQIGSLEDKQTSLKHTPNVVFERVVAEGLPAGWIKEVKLTKKKNIVRRDPYYIDPVSGYIFRSMRDALRYVATGDIGRLAFKPKEESPNAGLESSRSSLHSEAKRQKHSGMEGAEDESSEQVSHLTDDQMLESVYKEATPPPPDSTRPEVNQGNSTDEQRYACDRTNGVPDSGTEFPQDKHGFMDGTTAEISETPKAKQATLKSRKKKSSDLPRRTSSRLAGLVANPKVEVTRTCQATGNGVKDEQLNLGSQKKRFRRGKMSRSINELCSPVEDKLDNRRIGDEKEKETKDEERKKLEDAALPYQKLVLPFELPSGDILSDPCIEFAIKTLTGVSFDTSSAIKSSSAEQHTSVLPSKVNNNGHMDKASEMASSSLNLPFVDSWQDPCIEFAIKTLTGAIPVDFDSDIPDLMRQQMNSSQIQERTESNARVDNFCRTDLLWQHSEAADKNGFRQQNGAASSTQPLNVNMKRPSSSILR